jgi:hypothetical protein
MGIAEDVVRYPILVLDVLGGWLCLILPTPMLQMVIRLGRH